MKISVKLIIYLSIGTLIVISPVLMIIYKNQQNILFEQARIQAQTLFDMIVITRQWVADNNNRIEPVPAVATKELSVYANRMANFRFHITSDVLVNPANVPDEFEKRAIKYFRDGGGEFSEIEKYPETGKVYRYMAPLYINESCLKCHQYQGYKVGDFRGGISIWIPLKEFEKSVLANNVIFHVSGVILFTLTVLMVIVFLHRLVLRYLKALSISAKNLRTSNNLEIPVFYTGDEIEELSRAFHDMHVEIQQSEEKLKKSLKEAVSEYVVAQEQLIQKNNELIKSNNFKTDILDTLAHEIRTPLTKIISYTEILTSGNNPKDVEDIARETIHKNSNYLNKLFSQFLLLTKLEYSTFKYKKDKILLLPIVEEVIQFYLDDIEQKHIEVNILIDEHLEIFADEGMFQQVINNLVSNAIKYNVEYGSIEIKAFRHEGKIVFSISDTGIGIKQGEMDDIFKRFYRSGSVKKQISGTGLGLSIAYRIIKDHDGTLSVFSEYGKKTTFTAEIPG